MVATGSVNMVAARAGVVALRADGDVWVEWDMGRPRRAGLRLAGALRGLGVVQGEWVVLMMRNRPEFHIVDAGEPADRGDAVLIDNSSAPSSSRTWSGTRPW